jgi:hypothetical protein
MYRFGLTLVILVSLALTPVQANGVPAPIPPAPIFALPGTDSRAIITGICLGLASTFFGWWVIRKAREKPRRLGWGLLWFCGTGVAAIAWLNLGVEVLRGPFPLFTTVVFGLLTYALYCLIRAALQSRQYVRVVALGLYLLGCCCAADTAGRFAIGPPKPGDERSPEQVREQQRLEDEHHDRLGVAAMSLALAFGSLGIVVWKRRRTASGQTVLTPSPCRDQSLPEVPEA